MRYSIRFLLLAWCMSIAGTQPLHAGTDGFTVASLFTAARQDRVVKVIDLPETRPFQLTNGQYIDIGYWHRDETSGRWVGYVGSKTNFVDLEDNHLRTLMRMAGIAALPAPPAFRGGLIAEYSFYIVTVGFFMALGVLNSIVSALLNSRNGGPQRTGVGDDVDEAMARAIKENAREANA